jgi:hypothetical protein
MFLPDVLAGRTVAVAGPAGPAVEAVADAAACPAAGPACVLVVPADAAPEHLGAWSVFLMSPAGAGAAGQIIHLK